MDSWEYIKQKLAEKIRSEAFRNWILRTRFLSVEGDVLSVAVPDTGTKEMMETEYSEAVSGAILGLKLPIREVRYELEDGAVPLEQTRPPAAADSLFPANGNHLNARYTFSNFVVGSSNQFAHAAAQAVAAMPSRRYNPLFIYGGVGMGKTHLMHAIGQALIDNYSGMRIVYTTSERFTNQMVNCIKLGRMTSFHQHFRSADALLIDDIQFLAGKERTQEEFFNTFNELYDLQKQIVVCGDSPPKNTPGLVERLRSRFEWGLMVDVQPPDLETKMAILDTKAEQEGVKLPSDVRVFIATRTKSNVRELEGALIKLIAYAEVTGSKINMAMAQQVLKYLGQGPEKKVTADSVMRAVAERFRLQPGQLKQKSNTRQIAYPRQIAMYIIKELTQASLPEIGRLFGGKHHTTVLHSVQKIEAKRLVDSELSSTLHSLMDSLH